MGKRIKGIAIEVGAGSYESTPAPQLTASVVALATGNSANYDFDFGTLGLTDGYYQISVSLVVKRATTGDYRELRFAFSATLISGALVLMGTPAALTGAWNSAGIAATISVQATDNLRVALTNSSSETVNGRVHISFGKQPLIA